MKKQRIAVVIAVHNRLDYTRRCLNALRTAAAAEQLVTYVIDDGSTDGTGACLAQDFPEVRVLKGDGNLWFGGATQLGIDTALRDGSFEFIMTLNNDMFMRPQAIDYMLKIADSRTVVGAGYFEEDIKLFSTAGFLWSGSAGLVGVSWLPGWDAKASAPYVPVDAVSTTATLFPVELLKTIQPIDLRLHPHNRYDVMLSAGVRDRGARFFVTSTPVADHIHGELRRVKSCREQTWGEFMASAFGDPLKVTHIRGILHCTWHSAPNGPSALAAVIRRGGVFLAQALYVSGNTCLGRLTGRRLLNSK